MVPFCRFCNYATAGHIGMRIFDFVVLSVITAPHNGPTFHISNTHLPIVSLTVRELNLNWCSKDHSRKKADPPHPFKSVNKPKCTQRRLNEPKVAQMSLSQLI